MDVGGTTCGCGGALVQSPMVLDSSLSFERFLAALQRPLLPFWQCGGGTPVGGLGAAEPRGASPPAPPPALPLSGPAPAAAASRAARERTAARRAHRCGSARLGTPRREQSRGRGCPRGGQSRGNAVETPGAPGRARLVSAAAGRGEPESGRRDPAVLSPPGPGLCPPPPSVLAAPQS